jgi:hypothetical protein
VKLPMDLPVKRILALGATAVLLVLGTAGFLPSPADGAPGFPPGRPTRVLVLGDSVMKGAEGAVIAALPGREVVFDAEVSRSTGAGADIVAERGADWDAVVVLLGHNDGGSPGAFQPAARSILEQLRDVPSVTWLTIHEVRPYYPGVNQFIASLQDTYPNLRIGDWNAIAAANPGGVAGDGLHLNGTGAGLMAGLVADQVEAAEAQHLADLQRLAQATTTTAAPTTTTTTAPPTTTSTSTSTSTTTTEAPTTTTTEAEADVVAQEPAADDSTILLPALGAAVLIAVAFALILVVRRRRDRRTDQHTADTAG